MFRPLWIEIDLKALRNNFLTIRNHIERNVKIMAIIKQEAYGHGLIPIAKELINLGVDFFGVGSLEEAISLRKADIKKPILVLSSVFSKFSEYFIEYKITPTITNLEFAKNLDKVAKKFNVVVPVHIKVDTGMNRLGFSHLCVLNAIREMKKFSNLNLEGIFTHLSSAEEIDFTNYQINIFKNILENLKKVNINFKYIHCANSLGIINYKDSHFNMVRPGLILYGIKPIDNINFKLKPVLSLKSRIIFLKRVKKNTPIGYSRTFITEKDTNIATVACGYADGYPVSLSNKAKVIIKNKFFNLVGRVCMDHIMVDLGNKTASLGDEVILIGKDKDLIIKVEDISKIVNTIPYEIVSRLSLKIPRIYKT